MRIPKVLTTFGLVASTLIGVAAVAQSGGTGQAAPPVLELDVRAIAGVPADATAAVLNIAAAQAQSPGYVVAWPCDQPEPDTASLNYRPGAAVSNSTVISLSAAGTVCLSRSSDVELIVDINSAFRSGGAFIGQNPQRLLDTRQSQPLAAGQELVVNVAGVGLIPADASAATVNIGAAQADGSGYIVAWPCGSPKPTTAVLNYRNGPAVSNTTIVALGANGQLCVEASSRTDVIIDANGAFTASTAAPFNPQRLVDTRLSGRLHTGNVLEVQVAGEAGVPADATAAAINITAARPSAAGFVVAWPCGSEQPEASSLNFDDQPVSNSTIIGLGTNGTVCMTASTNVDLIIDLHAAFPESASIAPLTPTRVVDTRPEPQAPEAPTGGGSTPTPYVPPAQRGGDFVETFDGNAGFERFRSGVFHRDLDRDGFAMTNASWTGDHDLNCGSPATQRTITKADRSASFYTCRDHLMTSVGAVDSYSLAWFSPNQTFTASDTTVVSWDVNVTDLLARQWWEVILVAPDSSELIAHPGVAPVAAAPAGSNAPGLISYPEGSVAVGNGPFTPGPIRINGEKQGWEPVCGSEYALDPEGCASKAIRRTFTVTDNRNGTVTVDFLEYSWTVAGAFPDEFKVVFKDHNYTPDKDGIPVGHTWHWDNIAIR